jgi:hypothetical protein
MKNQETNKVELTNETFKSIFDETFNTLNKYNNSDVYGDDEYLSNDDVHDQTLNDTRKHFINLGYTQEELNVVES